MWNLFLFEMLGEIYGFTKFQKLLSSEYYFEIARKNIKREFVLNFKPEDFHHMVGLHKLIDIGLVQTGKRERVYSDIINNQITLSDVSISNYFDHDAEV